MGMGVHWGLRLAEQLPGKVALLDLRTLAPLDYEAVYEAVQRYHRVLLLTEEPPAYGFMQALAGWIAAEAFSQLDAPPKVIGSAEVPAVPLSLTLEEAYLPSATQIYEAAQMLLAY